MIIKIGFSTTNSWYSKIIRWFMKSNVSHSYIKIYDEFLKTSLVLHADFVGTVIVHSEVFDLTNIVVEEYEINDSRLDDAIRKNLWHLGKRYDWYDMYQWMLVLMFKRWFVRKVKDPMESPKKLICVDFILYILNASGIAKFPIGLLNPQMFMEWCQNNYQNFGWKRIVK